MEHAEVKKPKWLKKMEKESWQAELVVSGAAIYGSLKLPDSLDWLAETIYGWFSSDFEFVIGMFFTYSYVMAYVMILSFMFHFILRAFWIGMVGLNSVFPNGINPEKSNFPQYFVKRFVDEYGFKQNIIRQLDDFCSVLFAGCAYFVLVFVVVNIDLIIGVGVWQLLSLIIPSDIALLIIKIVVVFFIVCSTVSLFLNLKLFQGTKIARKIHYPCFVLGNKFFLHVFFSTVYHIGFTFMTNFSLKKYYLWTISFMLIVMVLASLRNASSSAVYFSDSNRLETTFNRTDRMLSENYENLRNENHGRIFSAVLESDIISGKSMRVFVPIFRNENVWQEEVCGKFEKPDGADLVQARLAKRPFTLECVKKYRRFYVNDKLYTPEIKMITHPNKGENGLRAYLATDGLLFGINILKVEKWRADTVARTIQIPFFFERN